MWVVVCPDHARSYALKGALRGGPNLGAVAGFDTSSICLTEIRSEVFPGVHFVDLDPDAAPMEDWFVGARQELEGFVPDRAALKRLEWVEMRETCDWRGSVENYSESHHCSLNHPTFACHDRYSSWFLWPMFWFQVCPGNILNTYHWRPVDAGHVVVWRGWYSVDGIENAVMRQLAVQGRETTVAVCIGPVESVQRGLGSRRYVPGPLMVDLACGRELGTFSGAPAPLDGCGARSGGAE
jgi:carnitine monooxygenase subunit